MDFRQDWNQKQSPISHLLLQNNLDSTMAVCSDSPQIWKLVDRE